MYSYTYTVVQSTVERAAPTAEMNEFDLIKKCGAAIPLQLRCH